MAKIQAIQVQWGMNIIYFTVSHNSKLNEKATKAISFEGLLWSQQRRMAKAVIKEILFVPVKSYKKKLSDRHRYL